ncbi:MAG: hypothetical protein WD767_08950 [Alphaproteobacteria bacterium]
MTEVEPRYRKILAGIISRLSRRGLVAFGVTLGVLGFVFLDGWHPSLDIITNLQYQTITVIPKMTYCIDCDMEYLRREREYWFSQFAIPYKYVLGLGFMFVLAGFFFGKPNRSDR